MNIVITEMEGEISSAIFSYEKCYNIEQVQKMIRKVGGDEKVISFMQLSEDDDL